MSSVYELGMDIIERQLKSSVSAALFVLGLVGLGWVGLAGWTPSRDSSSRRLVLRCLFWVWWVGLGWVGLGWVGGMDTIEGQLKSSVSAALFVFGWVGLGWVGISS